MKYEEPSEKPHPEELDYQDRGLDVDDEYAPADDTEPCYRDGSLMNECWHAE